MTATLDPVEKTNLTNLTNLRSKFDGENMVLEANIYQEQQNKKKIGKKENLTLDVIDGPDIYRHARKNLSCVASQLMRDGNQQMITFQNEQQASVPKNEVLGDGMGFC